MEVEDKDTVGGDEGNIQRYDDAAVWNVRSFRNSRLATERCRGRRKRSRTRSRGCEGLRRFDAVIEPIRGRGGLQFEIRKERSVGGVMRGREKNVHI